MSKDDIYQVVRQTIVAILPGVSVTQISGDKHIKDLGADSVDRVEIILTLIERLGIDEPMASFSDIKDIDALVDFLCVKMER